MLTAPFVDIEKYVGIHDPFAKIAPGTYSTTLGRNPVGIVANGPDMFHAVKLARWKSTFTIPARFVTLFR